MGGDKPLGLGLGTAVNSLGHTVQLVADLVVAANAFTLGAKKAMLPTASDDRNAAVAADAWVTGAPAAEAQTNS